MAMSNRETPTEHSGEAGRQLVKIGYATAAVRFNKKYAPNGGGAVQH